jgi:hypothetical protein
MRIGIVVDSACDLPQDFIAEHNIVLLPITVRIGEAVLADHRDEQATLSFLHAHVAEHGAEAETIPFSVNQIRDLFLQQLVIDYDHVFCMTITKTRSPIHDNALQASFAILNDYKPVRQAAGYNSPFALRVLDTQNLFAAQAVTAVEAVRLRDSGASVQQIRERLEELAGNVHGYMITRDLYYMRARAAQGRPQCRPAQRGAGQRAGHQAGAARLPWRDRAGGQDQGLRQRRAEAVRGGRPARACRADDADGVRQLRRRTGRAAQPARLCTDERGLRRHGVTVYESVMSLTGMVNVGKGAVTVGFADGPHRFE